MSSSSRAVKQGTVVRDSSDGRFYQLEDPPFKEGGEAWLYAVKDNPGIVAKIYKSRPQESPQAFAQRRLEAADKITVMLKHPPSNPTARYSHPSYAWPAALISGPGDNVVLGFIMPAITGMREVFDFYNPAQRRGCCPYFDYRYLHQTARNISGIFREIHTRGYVVGDVNQRNIFVSDRALVTIIDTDSFQVKDPSTGRLFYCRVRSDGFIPPEAYRIGRTDVERSIPQDLFGLGVLVFHLLMEGVHPFSCIDPSQGGMRLWQDRIISGDFPYAPGSQLSPMKTAPPFDVLNPDLRRLFMRCFIEGHKDPAARPTAKEWQQTLDAAIKDLGPCKLNPQHVYGSHLGGSCPWCARFARWGKDSFPDKAAQPPKPRTQPQKPLPRVSPIPQQTQTQTQTQRNAPTFQPARRPPQQGFPWGKTVLFAALILFVIWAFAHR
jgi:DNA-binding helix-hairpin-helix protein with protein kinase domain